MSIIPTLNRKEGVVMAKPDRHTGFRAFAENLDRRLGVAATIELVTEALQRLAELAYQVDRAGWVNADPVTGRLLIPAPWGKAGMGKWGLYPSEGRTLRAILQNRQFRKGHVPLFVYDFERRCWGVNLHDYPDLRSAAGYLWAYPLTVEEWRRFYTTGKR